MKQLMILTSLLLSTTSFASNTAQYICDEKSDLPSVITVNNGNITQYQNNFYKSKCLNSLTKNERIGGLNELDKALASDISKEEKDLFAKLKNLYLNSISECLKMDPPVMVSFDRTKNVLTELNLKYQTIQQYQCRIVEIK